MVVTWVRLDGWMENIYTPYNFSHFAIYVPKLIKVSVNLTNRNKSAQLSRHGVVYGVCNKRCAVMRNDQLEIMCLPSYLSTVYT